MTRNTEVYIGDEISAMEYDVELNNGKIIRVFIQPEDDVDYQDFVNVKNAFVKGVSTMSKSVCDYGSKEFTCVGQ